jgi:hypothetical protein
MANKFQKTLLYLKNKAKMDPYEDKRRGFLRKLGFTLGATLTATSLISANIVNPSPEMNITHEQKLFMDHYGKWMDEFIEVIKIQKVDPENIENNKNIVLLSERSKKWQTQLHDYMTDENFARYYMTATERMTLEI